MDTMASPVLAPTEGDETQPPTQPHPSLKRWTTTSSSFSSLIIEQLPLIPLYKPPRQRHRWGEPQQHPHKNWGDIFLDLFYVAAAYNLGHLLREDPTWEGLLYMTASFFSIQSLWMLHLLQDGRFQFATETLYQSVVATLRFLALACAVLHIRPVPYLSHPEQSNDMFLFSLAMAVYLFLHALSCLEIMYGQRYLCQHPNEENEEQQPHAPATEHHHKPIGLEPAAFDTAVSTLQITVIPLVLVTAAAVYSGRTFYHTSASSGDRSSTEQEHRQLAAAANDDDKPESSADHTAIYLLLASSLWMILYHAVRQIFYDLLKWDHKRSVVPINVEYAIHRYGEWTMLMLGETVLSLLIVDPVHNSGYYSTFYAGILSIIMVEYLHFLSQPHDPDHHALRRSIYGAILHTTTMMFYSASLIVLGASFKMLLYEFVYEEEEEQEDDYGSRYNNSSDGNSPLGYGNSSSYHHNDTSTDGHRNLLNMLLFQRELAGASSSALRFTTEERQQRIAIFFSCSMAAVWFCLDVLIVAHTGWASLRQAWKESYSPALVGLAHMCRLGILLWFVTLHVYVTEPRLLSLLGVMGLFGQIVLQMILYRLCPPSLVHQEEEEMNRAVAYANARLRVVQSS